jgi:hypothetical protein
MNPSASEVRRTPIDWIPTAILFGFAFLFATSQINNYDVWWHLRTGEWILQNRSVPSVDIFSFTAEGTPWIAHYWLSDVIFALVHRVLGLDGLILLCALVVSVSVAVAHRIMVRRGVDPFAAAFLLGLAVVAARFRFMARPHVFMFLFAVVFWWVLDSDLRNRPRRLLWLLPVMLLWVNMHGSFILALAFTGALFVQEGVGLWMARRSEGENPGTSLLLHIGGVGVGLTALCFASPYGPDLPAWVLRDFTSHAVTRTFELGEHAALAWGERPMIWGLMLAAAGSFALAPKKVRVFDLVVAAALTLLAVRSVRMGALASVYYAVVIGTNLMPLAAALRRGAARATLAPIAAAVASLALVAGGVIAFRATFTPDKAYRFGLGVMESRFPVDAVTFLGDLGFEGNVLNTWEFGGFLLWNLPGARTFSDGRTLDAHMDAVDRTRAMSPDELAASTSGTLTSVRSWSSRVMSPTRASPPTRPSSVPCSSTTVPGFTFARISTIATQPRDSSRPSSGSGRPASISPIWWSSPVDRTRKPSRPSFAGRWTSLHAASMPSTCSGRFWRPRTVRRPWMRMPAPWNSIPLWP